MKGDLPTDVTVPGQDVSLGRLRYTVGFLVRRLHNLLVANWGQDIAPASVRITPVQAGLLVLISENPDITQSRLIPVLDVESATLVKSITRLQEMGLIDKIRSDTDKRSFHLRMTERGWEVVKTIHVNMEARATRLAHDIDPQEFAIFLKVLHKLIARESRSSTWQAD